MLAADSKVVVLVGIMKGFSSAAVELNGLKFLNTGYS